MKAITLVAILLLSSAGLCRAQDAIHMQSEGYTVYANSVTQEHSETAYAVLTSSGLSITVGDSTTNYLANRDYEAVQYMAGRTQATAFKYYLMRADGSAEDTEIHVAATADHEGKVLIICVIRETERLIYDFRATNSGKRRDLHGV